MALIRLGLAAVLLQALSPEPAAAVLHQSTEGKAQAWPSWLNFE